MLKWIRRLFLLLFRRRFGLRIAVVNALTNQGVGGVTVRIAKLQPVKVADAPIIVDADSDGLGKVTLDGLCRGTYSFQVLRAPARFAIENHPDFDLPRTPPLVVRLPPSASISGRVFMTNGGPLAQPVFLQASQREDSREIVMNGEVKADGTYSLGGLNAMIPATIAASTPGTHQKLRVVNLQPLQQAGDVDIPLEPIDASIVRVQGKVTVDGTPQEGVGIKVVSLQAAADGFTVLNSAQTDAAGGYLFYDLPVGGYRITVYFNTAGNNRLPVFPSKEVIVATGTIAVADFVIVKVARGHRLAA